ERLLIHWTSANRDERTFPSPDEFDPAANTPHNLVYGTGKHVCPGRPLATLELVVALQELLAVVEDAPAETPGEREIAPVGGCAHAPVVLIPRPCTRSCASPGSGRSDLSLVLFPAHRRLPTVAAWRPTTSSHSATPSPASPRAPHRSSIRANLAWTLSSCRRPTGVSSPIEAPDASKAAGR